MNPKELAEYLENKNQGFTSESVFLQAATMLRQQEAEIKTLRNNGYRTEYELLRIEFINQKAELEELKGKQEK
jgi:hypothetical protein